MDCAIIVPARLRSQRFPRKLLTEVMGKPLILWTAERLREIAGGLPLIFAVAEEELAEVLGGAGYASVMTSPELPSGTDRLAAANREIGARRVINVQADEPLVRRAHIESLWRLLEEGAEMATLATRFTRGADFRDPNKVKVVLSADGHGLYFSRALIPFSRDLGGGVDESWLAQHGAYWHLGLYAYGEGVLERFTALPEGTLEGVEKLEQLRALEHGIRIRVAVTEERTVGIDVPEDVDAFVGAMSRAGG